MEDKELIKVAEFIEGFYNRKLEKSELIVMRDELKSYNYDKFVRNIKYPLTRKVRFFNVRELSNIIQEDKELDHLRDSLNLDDFDELFEN